MKLTINLPFLQPQPAKARRLLEAVFEAHQRAALSNPNVSTAVAANTVAGSGRFANAAAAAILTTGGAHAPLMAARQLLEHGNANIVAEMLNRGQKVPGFGNSFFKGKVDPAWEQVENILCHDFPEMGQSIKELGEPMKVKGVLPNAALFTAAACVIANVPHGTEDALFITARVPAWAAFVAQVKQEPEKPGQLFQITGLPRCGTAFLAVMLSLCERCVAYHEIAATDKHWKETLALIRNTTPYLADCSTYGFMPKAIVEDSRKVFIDKPWKESQAQAAEAFGYETDEAAYEALSTRAKQWASEWDALVIPSAELWTIESLRKVWDHCFQGAEEFPEQKVTLLLKQDIQRRDPKEAFRADLMAGREHELQ